MLGLLLDAGALMLIVSFVNDNDQVEFIKALLIAVAISVVNWIAVGIFAEALDAILFADVSIMACLAGLVMWLTLGMTLQRSMYAGLLFLIYKIGFAVVLLTLFSAL